MSDATTDRPLLEHTDDALARPMPAAVATARADVLAAAAAILSIPEAALAQPWPWKGGSEEEIRYGAYRAAEVVEAAGIDAAVLAAEKDGDERRAARIVAPATAARWDLHGVLLPLDDAILDADPGGDEWPIRLVLGHTISGQRAYGWGTAWWLRAGFDAADPSLPEGAPDALWADLPDEATAEAEGSMAAIRARLDEVLDRAAERLAGTPDEQLAHGARWSGFAVTAGFRLARWGSHIREHTIQLEKTLVMLGHAPTEPDRLARHLLAVYGRAEAAIFGRVGMEAAAERLATGAREARSEVEAAALAAAPHTAGLLAR